MLNRFWPNPLGAEGDMQTDDNADWPEEYRQNQFASVYDDEEDEEEQEEQVQEEDNDGE